MNMAKEAANGIAIALYGKLISLLGKPLIIILGSILGIILVAGVIWIIKKARGKTP